MYDLGAMPLTKQYLRYVSAESFGLVTGRKGDALFCKDASSKRRRLAVCAALEDVVVWDMKTSSKVAVFAGEKGVEVGVVGLSSDCSQLAVGREDGSLQLWSMDGFTLHITFNGHKSAVTCVKFDSSGTCLVSGSKDTHLVVWDLVNQNGLFRLKGHKGPVTGCGFLTSANVLISSSRDGVVKLWDVETQHCFQTLVGHRSEVWSIEIIKRETRLLTASGQGGGVKVFSLEPPSVDGRQPDEKVPLVAMEIGHLTCQSKERLLMIKVDSTEQYLAILSAESEIEIYHILSDEELSQRLKKKTKKAQKKSGHAKAGVSLTAQEEVKFVCSITSSTKAKIRSIDLSLQPKGELMVLLALQTNALELHSVTDSVPKLTHHLSSPGHRTDVRTVCFSSDDSKILSASSHSLKLWNRTSLQCIATVDCGYALCSTFVPGDRHVLIGTKSGHVQLFDLPSSSLLEEIPAHSGAVWGLAVSPDKRGVVSCGADHTVRFWEFELVQRSDEGGEAGKRLMLVAVKTLQMSEDVLSVSYSPDQRLLAVALLDSTIKVFFADSLKFFLSLYGHKLPVLSIDISSDSTLLVSCSADKNIRIWGLDFGDCHKSIFAHDDSIMAVKFVPDTHLIFSVSKDKLLKCWDADNFQHIQTLKGHHAEVWSLAVSHDGSTVVTGSHDLSLRLWERTFDPLVLSEEREMEREALMDTMGGAESTEIVVPGEAGSSEASLPVAKTTETFSTVDRLLEALEIWKNESDELREYKEECRLSGKELPPPKQHPTLVALGNIKSERHVLNTLRNIKSSSLEECLLVMPFAQVTLLLQLLDQWLHNGWEVELSCRCLFFLLRIHHHQLVTNSALLPVMSSLREHTSRQVSKIKDMYGINLAGLQYLQSELDKKGTHVFGDAPELIRKKRKLTQ